MTNFDTNKMGSRRVVPFPSNVDNSLLGTYREAIADGYNRMVDVGHVDKAGVMVMIGFLSAATIALKLGGNQPWASKFELVANTLQADWTSFQREIVALCVELDGATK